MVRGARMTLAAALLLAPAAQAQEAPALVQALRNCRGLTDNAARLACYDAAAGRFDQAERTGEVVVVDRAQARAARKQAFGFNLPSLSIFDRGEPKEAIDRAGFTIARPSQDAAGKWVLRTQDGQVWRQTDSERLVPSPRAGSKMEVRRATMGGFFAVVDGQRPIRVTREQ